MKKRTPIYDFLVDSVKEAQYLLNEIDKIEKECIAITKEEDYTFDAIWNEKEENPKTVVKRLMTKLKLKELK